MFYLCWLHGLIYLFIALFVNITYSVGYPQLSAVLEVADAAHGLNGHVISDGGCTCPGYII